MATWQEQLKAIQKLRQQRNENNEQLYSSKIRLFKAEKDLKAAERKETTQIINRKKLEPLRKRIAAREKQLMKESLKINKVNELSRKITDNKNLMALLEKKKTDINADRISERLRGEADNLSSDRSKPQAMRGEAEELKKLPAELEKN